MPWYIIGRQTTSYMATGDEVTEGSFYSYNLDSVGSHQSGDVLSPEDLAWADSCLIKDSEISDSDWDSLKKAFLQILTSQRDSYEFSAAGRNGFEEGADLANFHSGEEAQTPPDPERNGDDFVAFDELVDENSDEESETVKSRTKFRYPFLPNYSEYPKEVEDADRWLELTSVPDPSNTDIFKIWELDSTSEEDELVKQLNKALAESSLQPMPSTFDDSGKQRDLKDNSLDDLISGISDLSLNRISG